MRNNLGVILPHLACEVYWFFFFDKWAQITYQHV